MSFYSILSCSILFSSFFVCAMVPSEFGTFKERSCSGAIENDEMFEYCSKFPAKPKVYDVGTRYEYESFETISRALTEEIESDYDMVLLINSADGGIDRTPDGALIPNQHMLVLRKPMGQKKFFSRNAAGVISGIRPGVETLEDIIGAKPFEDVKEANARFSGVRADAGLPVDWNGASVVPVSTGKAGKMRAFSGVFQVNWDLSFARYDSSIFAPMSQEMYLGYYYHGRNVKRENWKDSNRERESWAAVHGTPPKNWNLLGKKRDSGGCARVHPMIQKHIRAAALDLPEKQVYELDWNFNLGEQNPNIPEAIKKPVLIIVFDRYDSLSV